MSAWSLFNLRKKRATLALVFDIGSASIGAGFVLLSEEEAPKLLYIVREEMKISKNVDIRRFSEAIKETLQIVIKEVQNDGVRFLKSNSYKNFKPNEIHFIFSSPWHTSSLQNIHFSKRNPFIVTHGIINNLVDKEIEEVRLAKNELYAKKTKSSVTLIEKKIINLTFDGYRVNRPNRQKIKKIDLTLFTSFIPKEILKAVEDPVRDAFNIKDFKISSFTLPFFSVMRDIWSNEENFLLVDVSGEVTEVSVVRDGGLYNTISFPIGRNTYKRAIAEELSVSIDEASSFIAMYVSGTGSDKLAVQFEEVLARMEKKWHRDFGKILIHISEGIFLPHLVFLTVSEPFGQWISKAITRQKQETLTQESFSVNLITSKKLSHFVHFEQNVLKDPFLMIDSLFINKLHNTGK